MIQERRKVMQDLEPCALTRGESIEIMIKLHSMCARMQEMDNIIKEVRDEIIRRQSVFDRMAGMEHKIDAMHETVSKGKGFWMATTAVGGLALSLIAYISGLFDGHKH